MLVQSNDLGEKNRANSRSYKILTKKGIRINDTEYPDTQLWILGTYVASPINMKYCKIYWQLAK
jgi:hypothetical protein